MVSGGRVKDSEDFSHWPSFRILPRPSRHFFGDGIEKGDVASEVGANDGVANGVEGNLGSFFFGE